MIIMIDNGVIVERGSYNELFRKKGYFYNLQMGQDALMVKKQEWSLTLLFLVNENSALMPDVSI